MSNINVTIRMDKKLKEQAENLFADFGLSLSSAITMFAKQAVREQRIPFEVTRNVSSAQFASKDEVKSVSDELIKKNAAAYKELAK